MRSGQAAMEFLMTYGWSIFVVLIAIGALAYFGVLTPGKFLSDKCVVAPPFTCVEYKITGAATSNVNISLQNGAGIGLLNMSVVMTCPDGSPATVVSGTDIPVSDGEVQRIVYTCPPLAVGERWRGNYNITYMRDGESVAHVGVGSLVARVE